MRPFTIAHISDLHLSAEHKRGHLRRARRLLDAIARHEVDHVVVTGDIAADAERQDFDLARRLFKTHGLLESSRMSLVIGNHDIYGGVHRSEDILTFPRRCKETDYGGSVEAFREHFHEAFERSLFASGSHPFPYAKVLGSNVLIGVNSVATYSGIKNPVGSNGEIQDGEFRRLRRILEAPLIRDKRKIVMIHHHFHKIGESGTGALNTVWGAIERQTMKLRGKNRLLGLFREHGVALVMHGHVHVNSAYVRKGVRFLNGGGSLMGPSSPESVFNLIRVEGDIIETRLITVPEEQPSLPAAAPLPEAAPARELQAA